jgi:uroporphyrinogen-III synthase
MRGASSGFPLHGWYVISLRPLGEHAGVRRAATRLGAATFAVSTLRLQALPAGPALRAALRCPRVVVTSPAAARFAHDQLPLAPRPGQHWYALGGGTAAALHRRGVDEVRLPRRGSDSEALLALAELQNLAGQAVGLVTAPGGRELLASSLRARGADLSVAEVYRREPVVPAPARLHALRQLPDASALLVTSEQALAALWQALDAPTRAQLLRRPCVTASARLRERAALLGFTELLQAVDARPASLLDCLAAHVEATRFR